MKDIFHDEGFSDRLKPDGGIKDLDELVGPIVYKIYKNLNFINTTWSCGGHAARSYDGYSTNRDGHYVYGPGHMSFSFKTDDQQARRFIERLQILVAEYPFASLKEGPERDKPDYTSASLTLEMKDLVSTPEIVVNTREQITDSLSAGGATGIAMRGNEMRLFGKFCGPDSLSAKREVRIELAEERMKLFKEFWKKMESMVDEFSAVKA